MGRNRLEDSNANAIDSIPTTANDEPSSGSYVSSEVKDISHSSVQQSSTVVVARADLWGDNLGLVFLHHEEDETLAQWSHLNEAFDSCDLSKFDFDINGVVRNYVASQESVMSLSKPTGGSSQGTKYSLFLPDPR